MEYLPDYDYRDVLWAPAKALQAKRILVATLYLLVGVIIYDIFTYIALAVDGENIGLIYDAYGLLPFTTLSLEQSLARIIYWLGTALAVIAAMLGMLGVAAIDVEFIRGNRFLSALQAIRFSLRRAGQIVVSELALLGFLAFVVILYFLFGLLTRIPFIGDWIFAVFLLFPAFFVAIFMVFLILVILLSVFLLPAVTAAERYGQAFNSILETFSTVIRQPVRWSVYSVYGLIAAKVCSFVYAYFVYRAVQFVGWAAGLGGGARPGQLLKSGLGHLPARSDFVREALNIFPGIDFGIDVSAWGRGGGDETVGYLVAVMMFIIFATVIGYALSVMATAQSRAYMVIRALKDAHRLGDEEPLFFTPEHVNPPIDEAASGGDDSAREPPREP